MKVHTHFCPKCGLNWPCVSNPCKLSDNAVCPDHFIETALENPKSKGATN